ncbi:hypothetical protein ABZ319_20850 [Nocardia sp. NPDC005978]|uniref:hypothetical protein n=1 Tax=Nocardia sp. NPDC005978 TaxID=3156725 RepID=UPI0033AC5466
MGKDPDGTVSHRKVVLTCVVVVAAAYGVAGLLFGPTPESAPQAADNSYVTPPVQFPVRIPGCDIVEPPRDGGLSGVVFGVQEGYDNPAYPWFSGRRAMAMTDALRAALPADAEIAFASPRASLVFQPILGDDSRRDEFGSETDARATVLRGDRAGALRVAVRQSARPVPPCVAGALDERRALADGTVVDVQDTWYEMNRVRTLSRTATAYLPDGTVASANATDEAAGRAAAVPLTVDELVTIVTTPGLRVTVPIPPGTPDPPGRCITGLDRSPEIDEARARRMNAVLAAIPLDGLRVDRPLGALLPADWGGLCQVVRTGEPGEDALLSIQITTGQSLPQQDSPDDGTTSRRLADGAVLASRESRYGVSGPASSALTMRRSRTVTVTRPSGTQIEVTSTVAAADEPVSWALLESIAANPGLDVS